MTIDEKVVPVGLTLYERQIGTLESMEQEMGGSVGRSAVLRRIIDEYVELEPVRRVLEGRRQGLLTHEEAMARLDVLVERDGADE